MELLCLVLRSIEPSFGYAGRESLSNPDVYRIDDRVDGAFAFQRIWA